MSHTKVFFPSLLLFLAFLSQKNYFLISEKSFLFYFFKIQKAKKELGRQAGQVWKKEGLKA